MAAAMTKRELVDRVMDGQLAEYVLSRRRLEKAVSWDRIALGLRDDFDIEVSGEAVRMWFEREERDQRAETEREAS